MQPQQQPNSKSTAQPLQPTRVPKPSGIRIGATVLGTAAWGGGSLFYGVGTDDIVYWYDTQTKEWIEL